jgi:hypothetical protein
MANSDKNILITPNRNLGGIPDVTLTGAGNSSISLKIPDSSTATLNFESSGTNLLSVDSNLSSGSLFKVVDNDLVSIFDATSEGQVTISPQQSTSIGGNGLILPRYSTSSLPPGEDGLVAYDTTVKCVKLYSRSKWINLTESEKITNGLVLDLDAGRTNSYPGTGTTWTDLSGSGYSTTINTTYVVYNSSNGGHLTFSGNGTTAQGGNIVGAASLLSSANTVEFAVYTPTSYYQILSNSFYGYGESDRVYSKNGSTNIVLGSTLNSWNMFSVTFNPPTTVTGYKNGVLGNTSSSFDFSGLTGDLPIGARPWAPFTQNFKLGYIRIYNRVLTATEIQQNFNDQRGRFGI